MNRSRSHANLTPARRANPLPAWCPSSISTEIGGKKWCFDPKTGGWICAEQNGSCDPDKGMRPWLDKLLAMFQPTTRRRRRNGDSDQCYEICCDLHGEDCKSGKISKPGTWNCMLRCLKLPMPPPSGGLGTPTRRRQNGCYHPGKINHPGRGVVACRMQNGATMNTRMQNPTRLGWAGIGLGAAALGGGGYWWWKRRQAAPPSTTNDTFWGGFAGPMGIAIPTIPRRQPNLGAVGAVLMMLGTAVAGTGGWAWWRNKQLNTACLGTRAWLKPDGKLTDDVSLELDAAIAAAIVAGKQTAVEIADSAIVQVSGDPDCRLPKVIWGELLQVRAHAVVKAALAIDAIGGTNGGEVPDPEVTGLLFDANCTTLTATSAELGHAYVSAFIDAQGFAQNLTWTPNALMLAASLMQQIAPQCGVGVQAVGSPTIVGVNTWQKAVMVGSLALGLGFVMHEKKIITDEAMQQIADDIQQWFSEHDIEQSQIGEVMLTPVDDWGESQANTVVESGSVGGANGGLWRVYEANVGEFFGDYYYKIWKKGTYTIGGPYDTQTAAKDAALSKINVQPAGIAQNPRRRFRRGATRPGVRDYTNCVAGCPGGGHPDHPGCVAECARRFPISAPKPKSGGFAGWRANPFHHR